MNGNQKESYLLAVFHFVNLSFVSKHFSNSEITNAID